MGCGASQAETSPPEPEIDQEALEKQRKADEAAAINAQIAAKMASKPVQQAEPFKRKFDGFKRAENRDRHNVKRTGAGADGDDTAMVRKSEVDRIKSKMVAAKQTVKLIKQKTTSFIVHFGDSDPEHADESLGQRIKRNMSRRSRDSENEPIHGHGLGWKDMSSPGGGLKRMLTRKMSSFTKRGSRSTNPSSSKLFATNQTMDGLDAYDAVEKTEAEKSNSKVKFAEPGTQTV
mmetsp:Transcript_1236/g.3466  ORF Transcript_1236/g.3466 Transcript_1236/m.3466 type:complete len:233 (-) Transcript_1236:310-1008(-)